MADDLVEILQNSDWNERVALRKVYELKNIHDNIVPPYRLSTQTINSDSGSTPRISRIGDDGSGEVLNGKALSESIVIDSDSADENKESIPDTDYSDDDIRPSVRAQTSDATRILARKKGIPGVRKATEHTTGTRWIRRLVGGLYVKTLWFVVETML